MPDPNSTKVLIVDDDEAIRTMVERILRRERFEVECAKDGFEAIEKLSRNDYAAVLLDLMMPRVDGHGVLHFLERERGLKQRRVIIMTADVSNALATVRSPSVAHVLPKPFDISRLIAQVRETIAA